MVVSGWVVLVMVGWVDEIIKWFGKDGGIGGVQIIMIFGALRWLYLSF